MWQWVRRLDTTYCRTSDVEVGGVRVSNADSVLSDTLVPTLIRLKTLSDLKRT